MQLRGVTLWWKLILSGVPRGNVLGLLLFAYIFIHLSFYSTMTIAQFSDDNPRLSDSKQETKSFTWRLFWWACSIGRYSSTIRPLWTYDSSMWGSDSNTNKKKIQVIQNRILCKISGAQKQHRLWHITGDVLEIIRHYPATHIPTHQ